MRFKNKVLSFILASLITISITGCAQKVGKSSSKDKKTSSVTLTISAAASLTETMEELKTLYVKDYPNVNIVYNFGSSGSLQHQIEQGAEVDIFLSAAQKQMDNLEKKGLILEDSRINLLENSVVLITPKDVTNVTSFKDITGDNIEKLALGEPESVPAGEYAEEVFKNLGILDKIKSKSVYAKDVKEVLAWVETGNADAGVVYETDAKSSNKITIASKAPSDSHEPILYPAAIIKSSKNLSAAKDFMNFLRSDEAKKVYEKYGFTFVEK
ncbi:molybdate ABC transporter substrate-binding protein [Clostridium sp.]|uniref:molybdate ABC transporter substrate-binding protein n=1 Tax=Clostridium sp. TaxID=1506 RepID=UPI0039F5EBB5